MITREQITSEFDSEKRILHLSLEEKHCVRTKAQMEEDFLILYRLVEEYAAQKPVYLILDITNLVIDPDLAGVYAKCAEKLNSRFVYPNGAARYGSQITRVTVKRAHREYLDNDPALFFTREEAYAYIENVRQETSLTDSASIIPSPAHHEER